MARCDASLDTLKEEIEHYTWTLRWLWLVSIAAVIYSIIVHKYEVTTFGVIMALVSMVGLGRVRCGRRLLGRAISACTTSVKADEKPSSSENS